MENQIKRSNDSALIAQPESRRIEGYAIVFERLSQILYDSATKKSFTEVIKMEAVNQELLDKSDVICRLCHNPDKVLARSRFGAGTLKLEIDDKGVKYSFDAPNTSAGDEALELIRRGDIYGSSFLAAVQPSDMEWSRDNGIAKCVIRKISLLGDVSPVVNPAYECTEAIVRSMATKTMEEEEKKEGYSNPLMKKYKSLFI